MGIAKISIFSNTVVILYLVLFKSVVQNSIWRSRGKLQHSRKGRFGHYHVQPGVKTIYLFQWTEKGQWNWLIYVLTQVTLIQGFSSLLIVIGDWFKAKQHVITQQFWQQYLSSSLSLHNYIKTCHIVAVNCQSNDYQTAG